MNNFRVYLIFFCWVAKSFKVIIDSFNLNWKAFRKIVGSKWNPGMNSPFDPIASQMAEAENMEVAILNGGDLDNVTNYIAGKKFIGTIIKD